MSEETQDDILEIGDHRFTSRLLLGTAAYPDRQTLFDCLEQSGTQLVTVSLRRVSVNSPGTESLYEALTKRGYSLLPNTAGCFTAREAILTAKMAREAWEYRYSNSKSSTMKKLFYQSHLSSSKPQKP